MSKSTGRSQGAVVLPRLAFYEGKSMGIPLPSSLLSFPLHPSSSPIVTEDVWEGGFLREGKCRDFPPPLYVVKWRMGRSGIEKPGARLSSAVFEG